MKIYKKERERAQDDSILRWAENPPPYLTAYSKRLMDIASMVRLLRERIESTRKTQEAEQKVVKAAIVIVKNTHLLRSDLCSSYNGCPVCNLFEAVAELEEVRKR